jgi:S1-C subfamily serine protease
MEPDVAGACRQGCSMTSRLLTSRALLWLVLVLSLLATFLAGGGSVRAESWSVRDTVRAIEPAIVWVVAQCKDNTYSQGSGFIVRQDGYILTNAHVVEDSVAVSVGWPNRFDRSQLDAKVVAMNRDLDLALLRVDGSHLPTVPIGSSTEACVGDAVIALGYPAGQELGLDNLTVTRGLLSSVRGDSSTGRVLLQTDATVTLGCSGGPLFDLDTGTVIGVIQGKGIDLLQGFNFAIPTDRLCDFAGTPVGSGFDRALSQLAGAGVSDDSLPLARALESYNQALTACDQSSWAEALSHFFASQRLDSQDPQSAYGLAESYAALDQPRQSLRWLERAFKLGYSDFDAALDSPGFSSVKDDERFVDLVRSF